MLKIIKNKSENKNFDAIIIGAGYSKSFSFRSGADKGPTEIIKAFSHIFL